MDAGRHRLNRWVEIPLVILCVAVGARGASFEYLTQLSDERMVFQTDFGRLEMAFYPKVGSPSPDCKTADEGFNSSGTGMKKKIVPFGARDASLD
jgi:hypothetical protein